jgi:predicted dehydrogenase
MSQGTKVGIIGGGWPGQAHARGYLEAGGFSIVAVADLIPDRREKLAVDSLKAKQYADAKELLADVEVEAVSICLPTPLHLPIALAAFKAKKHVLLETPPGISVKQSRQLAAAAVKAQKVLAYGFQRRFGGAELAAKQAIEKGYAGDAVHAKATWMRTRGIPIGTGWYTDRAQSGGGALMDLGSHMLDIGWHLLGQPRPVSVFAITRQQFADLSPKPESYTVEDSAFALVKFEGGKSLELAVSWAINQAPVQNGTTCRLHGSSGAVEVYTPTGPVLYRNFGPRGDAKATPLKQPKVAGHTAMARQFRECILGKAAPSMGAQQGIVLMQMIEALYRSAEGGKSVGI